MMTLLFLLSLVLALPTFGLSVVAFIVAYALSVFFRERSRFFHSNVLHAEIEMESGERDLPSWFSNDTERGNFVTITNRGASSKGVPPKIASELLSNTKAMWPLFWFAGAMERRGASFAEQSAAVSDKIRAAWNATPGEQKLAALSGAGWGSKDLERIGLRDHTAKDGWIWFGGKIEIMASRGILSELVVGFTMDDAISWAKFQDETFEEAYRGIWREASACDDMLCCHADINSSLYYVTVESNGADGLLVTMSEQDWDERYT